MHTPQNILITGGAGFIGSHVAAILTHKYPHYKVCSQAENEIEILQVEAAELAETVAFIAASTFHSDAYRNASEGSTSVCVTRLWCWISLIIVRPSTTLKDA